MVYTKSAAYYIYCGTKEQLTLWKKAMILSFCN